MPRTPARVRNSCLAYSPAGECVARYDKIHLFRFDDGTRRYDETRSIEPGTTPQTFVLTARDGSTLTERRKPMFAASCRHLGTACCSLPLCAFSPASPSDRQGAWQTAAQSLLRARREVLRIEWPSSSLATLAAQDRSCRGPVFAQLARAELASDVALTCSAARRLSGPAYSGSYFLPQPGAPGTRSGLRPIRA